MSHKPKGLIHFGMPKTGSSSIQSTLHKADLGDVLYWDWPAANHVAVVSIASGDDRHHVAQREREKHGDTRFQASCAAMRHRIEVDKPRAILISSERIFNLRRRHKVALKAFLDDYCDGYQVFGYVRDPVSFLSSSFQQSLKSGKSDFDLIDVWPHYRDKIEDLDAVFGQGNVTIRPFDRAVLKDGDVVVDCADQLGLPLDPAQIVRTNESLSLEAAALLFAERRFGDGFTMFDGVQHTRQNRRFVARLMQQKGQKFLLSSAALAPVLDKFREEIAWLEDRIAYRFDLDQAGAGSGIGSQAELLAQACTAAPYLKKLTAAMADQAKLDTPADIAAFLAAPLSRKGTGGS